MLLSLVFKLEAQQISTYYSNEIVKLANLKGFYETVKIINPNCLHYIDSKSAIEFALIEIKNNNYPYSFPHYSIELAKRVKDKKLKQFLFNDYNNLPYFFNSGSLSKKNKLDKRVTSIRFDLLEALINQEPENLIDSLKADFYKWKNISDDIESEYPFLLIRMFHYLLYGQPTYARNNQDCKFNYLKIATALYRLGEVDFDEDFLNEVRNEQSGIYYQNYGFDLTSPNDSLKFENIEFPDDYHNISQLLNDNEFFNKYIYPSVIYYDGLETIINIVINEQNNSAIIDLNTNGGCRMNQVTYIIEVINNNFFRIARIGK